MREIGECPKRYLCGTLVADERFASIPALSALHTEWEAATRVAPVGEELLIPSRFGALHATVIEAPAFEQDYLARGHAVHFSVPPDVDLGAVPPLRVDMMSLMRGVAPFADL